MKFHQRDFGQGASETILHPAVLVVLVVACALILLLPRKYVIVPLLMASFLIPRGQELYILGQHLYTLRILILTGFVRLALARFHIAGGMNSIDRLFIVWASYRAVAAAFTNGTSAVPAQVAFLIQSLCGYFLLRYLIQTEGDIARAAKALAVVASLLSVCMVIERFTRVNMFGYLGGVALIPEVRHGRTRAQGPFGISINAGCFGATLLPLFYWLWKGGRSNLLAVLGAIGSTLMVLTSNSSTPVLAYGAGVGALFLWPIRRHMRKVRWGIVLAIAALALVMKAPFWWIIAHVDVVGGSGGYDRAHLIDVCIRHFGDWWLFGSNQFGLWGWDMWDLSDQFVAEAEIGGLVTLACFIAIISRGFGRLGTTRKLVEGDRRQEWLCWSLGAVMFSNILAYFGTAYWDQTVFWWFALLAMVSAATIPRETIPEAAQEAQPAAAAGPVHPFAPVDESPDWQKLLHQ